MVAPTTTHRPKGRPPILAIARRLARTIAATLAVLVIAVATFTAGIFTLGALNVIHPATATAAPAAACIDDVDGESGGMRFNSCATLDPSTIDDLRTAA